MLTRTVYSNNQNHSNGVTVRAYPTGDELWEQERRLNRSKSKETYSAIMKSDENPLYSAQTVFPFTFFTDAISVDRNSVTIEYGLFFFSKKYRTFYIDQIHNVELIKGVLFSSLWFEVDGYNDDPPVITYLWNNDAVKLKEAIDGLILASKSQIDPHELTDRQIWNLVRKFTATTPLPAV